MHPLSFAIKRTHHSILTAARYAAKLFHLTPARFDLLYILNAKFYSPPKQADLARALGVTPMTISRMVRSLEQLGLLTRTSLKDDRRAKFLELTHEGRQRIRKATRLIMGWGFFHIVLEGVFGYGTLDAFFAMDDLYWTLTTFAKGLGDRSTHSYPTCHPDD